MCGVSMFAHARARTHSGILPAHTQIWVMWEKRQTHIPAVPLKGKGIPKSWKITHSPDENPQKCFNMCHGTLRIRLTAWLHANMGYRSSECFTACHSTKTVTGSCIKLKVLCNMHYVFSSYWIPLSLISGSVCCLTPCSCWSLCLPMLASPPLWSIAF